MTFPNEKMQKEMGMREGIRRENAARELCCALEKYECALQRKIADDGIEASLSLEEARAALIDLLLGRHES